jgi:hypothetical protein
LTHVTLAALVTVIGTVPETVALLSGAVIDTTAEVGVALGTGDALADGVGDTLADGVGVPPVVRP